MIGRHSAGMIRGRRVHTCSVYARWLTDDSWCLTRGGENWPLNGEVHFRLYMYSGVPDDRNNSTIDGLDDWQQFGSCAELPDTEHNSFIPILARHEDNETADNGTHLNKAAHQPIRNPPAANYNSTTTEVDGEY